MTENQRIFSQSTSSTVTLYWDKPESAGANEEYEVFLDGKPAQTVQRTHCTLDQLAPDTEICAEVYMKNREIIGSCSVRTEKIPRRINVIDWGAVGDGETMNTAVIQGAIDACCAGDEIYLPKGIYCTGALRLHSDMAFYLEEGAVLQGTENPEDYLPRIPSRFEGTELKCYSSLLNLGELDHTSDPNCRNVKIYGKGVISSGGQVLANRIIDLERERLGDYLSVNADLVATCENERTIPGRVRPRLINLSNCQNVRISGLTLQNGASWNLHMIYSDSIVTDHCTFISEGVWNGDGWDPDSSTNCTLFASRFYTADDSVAIKSGKNPEGNLINRPSKHIRIFDCCSAFGHGICMGSEISGGIEDVRIWDCDLVNSSYGVEIKGTKKRGGYVRNVQVRDCVLPRLMIHSVSYNDDGEAASQPPVFEHCRFERLVLTGRGLDGPNDWSDVAPLELIGFDTPGHELYDIVLKDCTICGNAIALPVQNCRKLCLQNICRKPTISLS